MNKTFAVGFLLGATSAGGVTWFFHAKALAALARVESALAVLVGKAK